MSRRRNKPFKESEFGEAGDFFSSIFGFIIDGFKVVFKLRPDEDQSMSEFLTEKVGAILMMVICTAILIGALFAVYMYLHRFR
jgi:hypothetical protein